ncbi:MAG: excinuclease ABC subunit UvrA [Candidatus Latescibacteria bacterium]|nr:excinuclease ABC subunit UvrA [Candidatus Latescibacterota bacterium]NIM21656.1 excinuclease ABC subunit UvrA [Candidatus Latescibacterota bacterium]NIM64635.1 excinuclease ABC subunit UvrA [Candidatus Latescibacterota bacterium]NIO01150.1 excinuclease ABC subunit UvrA [Candidatus Latescibacterota bacterium]NIO27543.1 excinuclease ABC subunit UvrA [Candidatus Latescibacterota bacterium]
MLDRIVVRGARQHNLKNIDLDIPHGQLTVITGVSGSGKSTLAFDTLYAEGQRRYIESLSTYTKQFLERIARPDVDEVSGINPSIAIQQKNTARSARSTVGTTTEIYDYLRLLFARVGRTYCPNCGIPVVKQSADEVIDHMVDAHEGERFYIVATISTEDRKPSELLAELQKEGYSRILHNGDVMRIDPPPRGLRLKGRSLNLVLDRLTIENSRRARLLEAIESAYNLADGFVRFASPDSNITLDFTHHLVCTSCKKSFEEPRPLLFSFNTPYGACSHCRGFGNRMEFDERLIVPDPSRSIRGQAVEPWASEKFEYYYNRLIRFCRQSRIPLDKPFRALDPKHKAAILEGNDAFFGVIPFLEELREKSYKKYARFYTRRYLTFRECRQCKGGRLRQEAYYVRLSGQSIREVARMTPGEALAFVESLELAPREEEIAEDIVLELRSRLKFLLDVGLYYVTLDRLTRTLSGGEAQRINLANSLGANLLGVLYVLDEPSIGLHPRDTENLVKVLSELRNRGNTVVVVEHDLDIIQKADYLVDLGPGAGENGGEVLYQGALEEASSPRSKTIKYLREGLPLEDSKPMPSRCEGEIRLSGITEHNLKNIDVSFPLGVFSAVTGVSGSGKSTLVSDVLYNALTVGEANYTHAYKGIKGRDKVKKTMLVDQSPIGKTPRSNPITYIKAFSFIRDIFASQRLAVKRGYASGRFSFNVPGGRCNRCQGMGYERVEMHFMADMFIPCSECEGKRYGKETLEVTFRGKNLADVLELSVNEAIELFADHRALAQRLTTLKKVGLGYLRLGQPSTTLSGGESQRIKIARELAENIEGGCFYILDEPTTGLHVDDVATLLRVLRELVDRGNTVVVVEHNPQVIRQADHIIDLGPGGGDDGGWVTAEGTPAEIARSPRSHTGAFLKKLMRKSAKGAA